MAGEKVVAYMVLLDGVLMRWDSVGGLYPALTVRADARLTGQMRKNVALFHSVQEARDAIQLDVERRARHRLAEATDVSRYAIMPLRWTNDTRGSR
jgi:hypothetical protein